MGIGRCTVRVYFRGNNYLRGNTMESFEDLTPNAFLTPVEEVLGVELLPFTQQLPSYINRVYELRGANDQSYVVKFYRPGRWSFDALYDEHDFLKECYEEEIPVVAPLELAGGGTLMALGDIPFALFPRKAGRQFDIESDDAWGRVGSLLGRIHSVGRRYSAPSRLTLTPDILTRGFVDDIMPFVHERWLVPYADICTRIIDTITPYFEGVESLRIHGDFHEGNILSRMEGGLSILDFDDMVNGPAAQDFWLLLPDHYPKSKPYLDKLMKGYENFADVPSGSGLLVEGLRAMRMIYFTAWSAIQRNDFQFQAQFPQWGSESFWSREVQDLRAQYGYIMDSLEF